MKSRAEKGEIVVKKQDFRDKKQVIGLEKIRVGDQNRKVKWCKMQVPFLKIDKAKGVQGQKWQSFAYFLTPILARTGRKLEWVCKINTTI